MTKPPALSRLKLSVKMPTGGACVLNIRLHQERLNPRMETKYEKTFKVRVNEVNFKGELKLSSMLNYFQDVAIEHASDLGFPISMLIQKNLTWVVSRYHLQIDRAPLWGETLHVTTWPSDTRGRFAIRDFEIRDKKNLPAVAATASFMLLDFVQKKTVPIEENLPAYPVVPARAVADSFESLPGLERVDLQRPFHVRMHDLDLNHHVNNTYYVEWAIESLPMDIIQNCRVTRIEVAYRGQAVYGDEILSQAQVVSEGPEPVVIHRIVRESDGRELARLKTQWTPAQGAYHAAFKAKRLA